MSYYLFPFDKIPKNSRIVLYGAGNVGRQFYAQVTEINYCEIVLWLDKKAGGIHQKMPETIVSFDVNNYDIVVIAIKRELVAKDVKDFLINSGVPESKILHQDYHEFNKHPGFHIAELYPIELTDDEKKIIDYVINNGLTMVPRVGLFATLMSCKYVIANNIDGDFVECGVWRGGNSIIAAYMFKLYNSHKKVYLYDTFEGMTPPTEFDINLVTGLTAKEEIDSAKLDKVSYCSIDEVKTNFSNLGLLSENVIFVQGDVLQTLEQNNIPEKIAVLRLDTDWYESTKKEMEILYPRITREGVLIIDDYGHCAGSKKAVDEFFENSYRPFLQYIDYTRRLGIKL